jgi:hypothetical protein
MRAGLQSKLAMATARSRRPIATTADQCDGLLQSLRDQINVGLRCCNTALRLLLGRVQPEDAARQSDGLDQTKWIPSVIGDNLETREPSPFSGLADERRISIHHAMFGMNAAWLRTRISGLDVETFWRRLKGARVSRSPRAT